MSWNIDLTLTGIGSEPVRVQGSIASDEESVPVGHSIDTWLSMLDPEELERLTLERFGPGDKTMDVALGVLRAWARGEVV